MPRGQTIALAVASTLVATPSLVAHGGGAAAISWAWLSAAAFWAGVGASFSLRDARSLWLRIAWLGAFLELDISLRYRRGWALGVGLLLLGAAALARRIRVDDLALVAVLAAVPLLAGGRVSPAFVSLGPACLLLARSPTRALRALVLLATAVYTSGWPSAWLSGLTDGYLRGALAEPRLIPARFELPTHRTSHIRLRQLGRDPVMLWSIAELQVLGPPLQGDVASGWQAGHQ